MPGIARARFTVQFGLALKPAVGVADHDFGLAAIVALANGDGPWGGGLSGGGGQQSFGANASVGYKFAQNLNGSLNYHFSNSDRDGDNNDITENLISVSLSKSF